MPRTRGTDNGSQSVGLCDQGFPSHPANEAHTSGFRPVCCLDATVLLARALVLHQPFVSIIRHLCWPSIDTFGNLCRGPLGVAARLGSKHGCWVFNIRPVSHSVKECGTGVIRRFGCYLPSRSESPGNARSTRSQASRVACFALSQPSFELPFAASQFLLSSGSTSSKRLVLGNRPRVSQP